MLQGQVFYFSTIRNITAAIGNLFNDVHLVRTDSAGNVVQDYVVPLAYAPKQHYIIELYQNQTNNNTAPNVATKLPRMSFEFVNMTYDSQRQSNPYNYTKYKDNADTSRLLKMLNPVPYNFQYEIGIYAKNMDDSLQIIEQIVPWFTQDFNLSVIMIPSINYTEDLPVILDDVSKEDNFEEGLDRNRLITWRLGLTVQGYIYKPTASVKAIKRVLADIYPSNAKTSTGYTEIMAEVTPNTAAIDDPWTVNTTVTAK